MMKLTAAQQYALHACLQWGTNSCRASRKVSSAAFAALAKRGLVTLSRDEDGVIATLTVAGGEVLESLKGL